MMKRCVMLLVLFTIATGGIMAQKKVEYQESQARLMEPKLNVYVKPLIVDLKVLENQKRVTEGPFLFPDKDVAIMTLDDLEKIKTNALYLAAKKYGADIIVAATFDVKTSEKTKGLEVTVTGFPAVYSNWRTAEEQDYQWIREAYENEKNNTVYEKVQALKRN